MELIRYINANSFAAIQNGSFTNGKIAVYYGYPTVRVDAEYLNMIVEAVKFENPNILRKNMYIRFLTKYHPDHRPTELDHLFIQVMLPVEQVMKDLSRYTPMGKEFPRHE